MYGKIVVGTDGSETASAAVSHAAKLASEHGAELHLVTACQTPAGWMGMGAGPGVPWTDGDQQRLESDMASVLEAAAALCNGVKPKLHPMLDEAANAIIATAESEDADLIVVGNRGMNGAGRFLLGSVPNRISHHAPCSVLIVKTS